MQRELVDAFVELGRSFALYIVLEDLHWADDASADLIAYLSSRLESMPLLMVGTFRPAELHTEKPELERILLDLQGRRVADRMDLAFLDEGAIRTYLGREFGDHRFPPEFPGWLASRTEGNPLLITDLLRYLVAKEVLVSRDGWKLAMALGDIEAEIPASGRAMLQRMTDRLTPDQRRLLECAAVAGETFDSITLGDVLGLDTDGVEDALGTLDREHRLVTAVSEEELPDGSLTVLHRFVHVLYQNRLYHEVPPSRRVKLHRGIGAALDRHLGAGSSKRASELALHFERGQEYAQAIEYYLQAAKNEQLKFAIPQAETFCDRAAQLVNKLIGNQQEGVLVKVLEARAQLRIARSAFDPALEDLGKMEKAATRAGDVASKASALCLKLAPLFYDKRRSELESLCAELLELGRAEDLPMATATAWLGQGALCQAYGGNLAEAETTLRLSLEEARRADVAGAELQALSTLVSLRCFQASYRDALEMHAAVRRLAVACGDGGALLETLFFAGMARANSGNLADAQITLEEAQRLVQANGDRFWLPRILNTMAWLHFEAFDYAHAQELNRVARELAHSTQLLEPEANSAINLGQCALQLGEMDLARDCLADADNIFDRDDFLRWRYRQRLELAWSQYHLLLGNLDAASKHAHECVALAERTSRGKHMVLAYRQLAVIALRAGRTANAKGFLEAAVLELARTDATLAEWRVHDAWSDYWQAVGEPEKARGHADKALNTLTAIAESAPEEMRLSILSSRTITRLKDL
jgi:hypothetical protein